MTANKDGNTVETLSKPFVRPTPSKDSRYERWRYTTFAVTWITYAGFYLTRQSFSAAKAGIIEDPLVHVSKSMLGVVDAAYLIAYAIGQFIWGVAGDRFGCRKVVLTGILLSIVAGFAMGVSSVILLFGIFSFAQGIAQASGWAPLTKNIGCWFSQKERGRIYGWWCSNYSIGPMIATPFAGYMAEHFTNWRYAFFIPAATFLLIWFLALAFQRNKPEDVGLVGIEEYHCECSTDLVAPKENSEDKESSWEGICKAFKNLMVIRLAVVYFLLKPTRYALILWGPLMVKEKLGKGMGESALISALFTAAGPLGVLFAGYASDKLFNARRVPICVISLILLAIITCLFDILTHSRSPFVMGLMLFAIGFLLFGPDSILVATAAVDFGTKRGASTAVGLINGFGSAGAVLGGSLPGLISEKFGWGALFYSLAACSFVAGALLLPKWNAVPAKEE
ncbi:MAG: MFS transporter [Armatimonadetes bacterium]|nr:MFS transporter [Armatimonadota bacterium]